MFSFRSRLPRGSARQRGILLQMVLRRMIYKDKIALSGLCLRALLRRFPMLQFYIMTGGLWRAFAHVSPVAHVLVMRAQVPRKAVAARTVGDKIQLIRAGRLQHRLQRRLAGIGDGRRW